MDILEEIKHKADSWYDFMLKEVDKAVQEAWNRTTPLPSKDETSPQ